jgi:hypothetical protein
MQPWVKNQIQKKTENETALILPAPLFPKAAISCPDCIRGKGRSSDLLHFFAAFPFRRTVAMR